MQSLIAAKKKHLHSANISLQSKESSNGNRLTSLFLIPLDEMSRFVNVVWVRNRYKRKAFLGLIFSFLLRLALKNICTNHHCNISELNFHILRKFLSALVCWIPRICNLFAIDTVNYKTYIVINIPNSRFISTISPSIKTNSLCFSFLQLRTTDIC